MNAAGALVAAEGTTMKKSEIIRQQLAEVEAKYEANGDAAVAGATPETFSDLWRVWYDAEGRILQDQKRALEMELARELNREIEVGDGATLCLWSDREAHTVIARTAKTLTIQRDKAIRDPSFKPEWVPGGFSAICTNSEDQRWTYERDPKGSITKCHWSEKRGCWQAGSDGSMRIIRGRHEHYDYNF